MNELMLIHQFFYDSSPHSPGSGCSLCGVSILSNNWWTENSRCAESLWLWCSPKPKSVPGERKTQGYSGGSSGGISPAGSIPYAVSDSGRTARKLSRCDEGPWYTRPRNQSLRTKCRRSRRGRISAGCGGEGSVHGENLSRALIFGVGRTQF